MINTKNLFIKMAPKQLVLLVRRLKYSFDGFVLQKYQSKIFNHSIFKDVYRASEQQLQAKLSFHSHAIEKGLSHEQLRLGFGVTALNEIQCTVAIYKKKGFDTNCITYKNTLAVLHEYYSVHKENNYDTTYFDELFKDILNEILNETSQIGGVKNIKKHDTATQNFKELFESRWSVREYASGRVDIDAIKKAIDLSKKSPSVCNRQSARVRVITDENTIKNTLKIQGGFTGYDSPPALLVVSSDMRTFLNAVEKNQPYIDGGIFSMSLLLSLEYYKIAACPLNTMFNKKRELLAKRALKIPEYEALIMFISVGKFKANSKVPKSFRLPLKEIIKY